MTIDLPPDLPPPMAVPADVQARCVAYAARHYQISPLVLQAVADVEGGKAGTVSENSNGTYDLGVMQINTVNLDLIRRTFPSVGWRELTYSPCINIGVAAWFLTQKIREAGEFWRGVGNYHSATPRHHERYLRRVYAAYQDLLRRYQASR